MADEPTARPLMIEWRLDTGIILTSLPGAEDVKRSIAKPYIPMSATHWRRPEGEWHPLADLPPEWGLRPVGAEPVRVEIDEEDEAELERWRWSQGKRRR